MDKVFHLNIKSVHNLLLNNEISVKDLVCKALEKVEKTHKYNAFIKITDKEAKQRAAESCDRFKNQKPLSPLDGIPISIKDNFCTSNIHTTCASEMLRNFIPKYDATVYERLLKAGAILIGKTNLDQFAMGSGSVDSIFGPVKHPRGYKNDNEFYISGGSSGGTAVSVATGTCWAGLGSDTGGSTRHPASFCGIVGLKPTYGLLSRHGLIPLANSMDVPGIITRNVDDCALVLNCIAGFDPKDSASLGKQFKNINLPPATKLSVKGLKIGIPKQYHCEHLDSEIRETWNDVAKFLKNNGAVVKEVSMPHTEWSIVCYSVLNQCAVASNMACYDGIEYGFRADENESTEKLFATTRSMGFNDVVKSRIVTGNYFLLKKNYEKYFSQALKVRRLILQDFDNVWEDVQVLLTPTTITTPILYEDYIKKTNRDQCAVQDFCTQPVNMAGVPALALPIKLSKNGMPISLQIIGRNLSESCILGLAKFIEHAVQFEHNIE